MRIPKDLARREQFFYDTSKSCFASVETRKTAYALMKYYYEYGCAPEEGVAPYNKIYPTIETQTAFLFSADSTRFSAHLPPDTPEEEWAKVPAATKAVNSEWQRSNGDLVFKQCLTLSKVYGSMFMKSLPKSGQVAPFAVEPHMLGVFREDLNYLDRQEAVCHRYTMTKSALTNELVNHPQRGSILARLATRPRTDGGDDLPDSLRRIIVTNQAGVPPLVPGSNVTGNGAAFLDGRFDANPKLDVPTIDMEELWVWDDEADDYRVATIADGYICIYDRANFYLPKEHPFTQVCPNPAHGYFWGHAEISRLIPLQQFRNERIRQIRELLAKQVRPPTTMIGMWGAYDELDFALNQPGGVIGSQDPTAKAEQHRTPVPDDVWHDVNMIDEMFAEVSGLQNLLQGKGEAGVRSGRQTSELARLGSARIKQSALLIEDSLESIASKYFRVMRKYDDSKYRTEPTDKGVAPIPFTLKQMTEECIIKVDAHSNSPLFVEDQKADAAFMLENKVIDRESYLEITNPPMKDVLIRRLKVIEAGEQAAAKEKMDMERAELRAKHGPRAA